MLSERHHTFGGSPHRTALLIQESKERCVRYGLQPHHFPDPLTRLSKAELEDQQIKYSEVLSVVENLGAKVMDLLSGTPVMILVSDPQGYIITLFGDQSIKEILKQLGIVEGIQLNEREMGTNVVHLALTANCLIQVVGPDHYHEALQQTACYCVPFHLKEPSPLSGSIGFMTTADLHNSLTLPLLANMVDSMERELLLRQHARHQTLINEHILNAVPNGVLITDAKGNIVDFNQFAEKITNRKRQQVLHKPVFAFEQFGNLIYEVLKNKKSFDNVELTFTNSLEHRTICLFDAMPILQNGMLLGAYAQFRDITERRELEKQIIVSEKYSAIGKLGAGLAHEIRNPLTSVMGFIQLMKERQPEDAQSSYLQMIYSELETMKTLVSDFVLMSKPASPDRKECLIEELIRETIRFMESQAILKRCEIVSRLPGQGTVIRIDPIQIKQVLINLIQNAIEAMPYGGIVRVSSRLDYENKYIHIHVADAGMGMTEDQMRDIMTPFFSTKDSGLGLGLSTCYRIIENHLGKLTFQSQIGLGSTFTISLPL
ncbi:ATP-binding protein [Paenibacillus filicis]|uniref:histidine kinase n=1 Tax=Paenibacillus filicis TaxID=669464 RepID=A0ABU9DGW9_9BACL